MSRLEILTDLLASLIYCAYIGSFSGVSSCERADSRDGEVQIKTYDELGKTPWMSKYSLIHMVMLLAINSFPAQFGSLFGHDSQINTTLPLLTMSKEPAAPSQLQADAIQALLGGSSKKQCPQQRWASSFGEQAELADESSTNKYSLLCPKETCGSLILKPGIAVLTPNKQAPASIPRLVALISFSKMATDLHGYFLS